MGDRIVLNVRGELFQTSRSTLLVDPNSMLATMFNPESRLAASVKDENGAWFIDRDPKYFRVVLNFLCNPSKLVIEPHINVEGVLQEAQFFQIQSLIDHLQFLPDILRQDVILYKKMIQLSGVRLSGLDLSDLDFGGIQFERSFIDRSNFERCNLVKASFMQAHGTYANFSQCTGADTKFTDALLTHSTFDNADLPTCNFSRSILANSSFVGANCNGALFQKSDASDTLFTHAKLQNVKFHEAVLTNADFSGAHLDYCHFSYADLRGAKNIDWAKYYKTITTASAIISHEEYLAIPLSEDQKARLQMAVQPKI